MGALIRKRSSRWFRRITENQRPTPRSLLDATATACGRGVAAETCALMADKAAMNGVPDPPSVAHAGPSALLVLSGSQNPFSGVP